MAKKNGKTVKMSDPKYAVVEGPKEFQETEIVFRDKASGKEATIILFQDVDENGNKDVGVRFDWGADGVASHNGTYIGVLNQFAAMIGVVKR